VTEPSIEYVNIRHAGEIAGVSRRTIYNWLAEGKLSYVRTAGGSVRIDRASLLHEDPMCQQRGANKSA